MGVVLVLRGIGGPGNISYVALPEKPGLCYPGKTLETQEIMGKQGKQIIGNRQPA